MRSTVLGLHEKVRSLGVLDISFLTRLATKDCFVLAVSV